MQQKSETKMSGRKISGTKSGRDNSSTKGHDVTKKWNKNWQNKRAEHFCSVMTFLHLHLRVPPIFVSLIFVPLIFVLLIFVLPLLFHHDLFGLTLV